MTDHDKTVETILERALEQLAAGKTPLERVADIPTVEAFVAQFADATIAAAREQGASWSQIADQLGVSRQAAHKRFTRGDRQRSKLRFELRFGRDRNDS